MSICSHIPNPLFELLDFLYLMADVCLCSRSFMAVLICLIFSVLSTIDQYVDFANETLFWMVSVALSHVLPLEGRDVLGLVCVPGLGL